MKIVAIQSRLLVKLSALEILTSKLQPHAADQTNFGPHSGLRLGIAYIFLAKVALLSVRPYFSSPLTSPCLGGIGRLLLKSRVLNSRVSKVSSLESSCKAQVFGSTMWIDPSCASFRSYSLSSYSSNHTLQRKGSRGL